jgi:hypothetical protein
MVSTAGDLHAKVTTTPAAAGANDLDLVVLERLEALAALSCD